MIAATALPALYEDLANHFARQGESRQRDQCLVLAADAALSAGLPQEAERLRKRLLMTNPHHMLRPYASMGDALKSHDVRDYIADLRKQWPPATVEKLVSQRKASHPAPAIPVPKPAPAKPAAAKLSLEPTNEPVTFLAYLLTMIMLGMGLMLALSILVVALIWPLFE